MVKSPLKTNRVKPGPRSEEEFVLKELGGPESESYWSKILFFFSYNLQEARRRKCLFLFAFLAVFICVLSSLLIDVLAKKGSLIYLRMNEELPVDAHIMPSFRNRDRGEGADNFHLNFTRVMEQNIDAKTIGRMVPRHTLHGVHTLRARETPWREHDGGFHAFEARFDPETGLPTREDVYANLKHDFELTVDLVFIDFAREKEEDLVASFEFIPPFGHCIAGPGWVNPGEIEFLAFGFDFEPLMKHYNREASQKNREGHNW